MRTFCSLTLLLALTLMVSAAEQLPPALPLPGPELAKMSNLAFGWVSMSGVDPTLDALASFAPTMLALRDAGYTYGGETATGTFSFGDFEVDSSWRAGLAPLGPGLFRIAYYDYESNTAKPEGFALPAQTRGESIELSYAQRIGTTQVGVSYIPKDESTITVPAVPQLGLPTITGRTDTDYGVRVGAMAPLKNGVRVGANYSYQRDAATLSIVPQAQEFTTKAGTVGASWQATPSTTVYGSYQKISCDGGAFSREAELVWFGVQQELTKTLAVRANYLDGGPNVSVRWISPIGVVNAAYTHKALLNARDMLGVGDGLFVGLDIAR